jgi:hypothetical protein
MVHLFRPAERAEQEACDSSPRERVVLRRAAPSALARLAGLVAALTARQWAVFVVWGASIAVQCLLLWAAGELLDLYVSAVELWAELAQKHLELTLS